MAETDTKQVTPKPRRRWSLKWKWALGTAIGSALIFICFSLLVYKSFTNLLLRQEQRNVASAVTTVQQSLRTESSGLTIKSVAGKLQPEASVEPANSMSERKHGVLQSKIFTDSDLTALSRTNLAVTVYDPNGNTLYLSRKDAHEFSKNKSRQVRLVGHGSNAELVGRAPIYAASNHKLIGYTQVTDNLSEYHATTQNLIWIFIVMTMITIFGATLLGYFLAAFLLRPMRKIKQTINAVNDDPQNDSRVPDLKRNDELSDLAVVFNDMLDQMQRYITQQQQFVEDVSHELRTPVAIIQGHMELLNRWGKDDPQVLSESLAASLSETKRMQSLVQEMLDLSRAEQLEINFSHETSDVQKLVTQAFNDFKMIHPDFSFTFDDDVKKPVYAQIYRNHLEQVLIILLDNAVKYSTRRKEIHLSLSTDYRYVEVAVQDFGEGISKDNLDRVFNRFYRVDKARSRDKGGNGLGLSIAQRLIEGYHGHISVESVVGQGSIFRFQLPILRDAKLLEKAEAETNDVEKIAKSELPAGIKPATRDEDEPPLDDHEHEK
ncbi:HAMP domain-containing sensor histidine kinase [Lactiplantibacillus pentosus]|uniref:HAMP domain-containing sensor histidine kinase n=1 Tax=Lactiplantibacillus pentosus TaxID=1589 RepID=UPI0021A85AE5|nr:HAMP domain-containing histidine kinase [Lactiplantibacillus pentosus]MCT3296254.1 sensor histidine kinase [Lactiplantibacillus pentosus]